MAEELADYLQEMGVRNTYLHSEIKTLGRSEILRDLRLGVYDVVVASTCFARGLDLPEVSLVAILDADKEGYLRSDSSLIQTIGRAARHASGHVVMYADNVTASMQRAIDETSRRRTLQHDYNEANDIIPQSITKAVRDITERVKAVAEDRGVYRTERRQMSRRDMFRVIKDLEAQMKYCARNLEFEKAALLRDEVYELRRVMAIDYTGPDAMTEEAPRQKPRARPPEPVSEANGTPETASFWTQSPFSQRLRTYLRAGFKVEGTLAQKLTPSVDYL